MKTTIEISDSLFEATRGLAGKRESTFRDVVETALRLFLKSQKKSSGPFKLRKHTFRGQGLMPGLSEGEWERVRERVYEGRGG